MKTKEIRITRFVDVVGINAFIARRPERARIVFKTSGSGLWQLDLTAEGEERRWTVGHHVEDGTVEYDVAARRIWRSYVNEELEGMFDDEHPPYVVWRDGGWVFVTLPHMYEQKVVAAAPDVCRRADPGWEPVYVWRGAGRINVLDCGAGLTAFRRAKEFVDWVVARTPAEDEASLVSWPEWYVITTVSNEEEWPAVVRRAACGRLGPDPDGTIEFLFKSL
jgi:hypothetical protein